MWRENLQELKKRSKMTLREIAEISRIPESTVKRVFSGDNEPSASTLFRIVAAMGGSLDDILSDTNAVIAPPSLVEIKDNVEVVAAEKEVIVAKNDILEAKLNALTMEVELLKKELLHKDQLLAVHEEYLALFKSKVRE